MNSKRTWIEKLGDFISGKGFYLVVLICVAAIALSGFYLVQGVRGGLEDVNQPVSGSAAIEGTPSPAPSPAASASVTAQPSPSPAARPSQEPPAAIAAPTPSPAPSQAALQEADDVPSPSPTPAPAPAALVFTWPVNGTVIADYSVEALAYNETMGDWRTHEGLDLAVSLGTQVMAAANGTVSAIYQDDFMGTTVEIDHGDGLVSRYCNLAETPTVAVGDAVSTGAIIGSTGSTAAAERGLQAHLHFAMYQDGNPVNPADYLP